jgi:hypothetical protein
MTFVEKFSIDFRGRIPLVFSKEVSSLRVHRTARLFHKGLQLRIHK